MVRRITGRSPGTVFRQEIAEPLDADFRIGLPESEDHRVAELVQPPGPAPEAGSVEKPEIPSITFRDTQPDGSREWRMDVAQTRTRAWRGAEIPSVNGHGNARSIAGIHAVPAIIDLDARTSFAYAMNRMDRSMMGDERSFRILRAMWHAPGLTAARAGGGQPAEACFR